MYDSLRLAAGGGLNGSLEKVEQAKNTFSLAIGIGGTGFSALSALRQNVHSRIKQDNYDRRDVETPKYDRIQFLQIDSDAKSKEGLDASEFFYVGTTDILDRLDKARQKNDPWIRWFNKKTTVEDARQGAGGVRQAGKLLLQDRASELREKIRGIIRNGITGLGKNFTINIYVMAGIGGGTGSGCFIDVCYIVQQVLTELGYRGAASVLGFFFLPDVNLASENFPKLPAYKDSVKENGYAALQELDYLMGIPENGGRYKQQYGPQFTIDMDVSPVTQNLCHLISATTTEGVVHKNGYNYAMQATVEYILNYLVSASAAKDGEVLDSSVTIQGLLPNLHKLIGKTTKDYGVNYKYNILGASCAVVPYQPIGTYLATKTLEAVKYMKAAAPQKSDVETFCTRTDFTYDALYRGVTEKVHPLPINPENWDVKLLKAAEIGEITKPLYEKYEKWLASSSGEIQKNIATLQRKLDSYDPIEAPDTVLGRIFKELVRIIENPDLGIYFAAGIMKGMGNRGAQNHNLDSVLQGIQTEVTNKRDEARRQQPHRSMKLDKAQEILINSGEGPFSGIKKKKENYLKEVQAFYKNLLDIATYDKMLDMLTVIKGNLEELNRDYFKKYVRIFDELFATFEDNAEYFARNETQDRYYTWSIVDIASIKGSLDEIMQDYVEKDAEGNRIAPDLVRGMNSMMLRHQGSWLDEKEEKINYLFSEFIRKQFQNAMKKTMKEFLEEKFKVKGTDLVNVISKEIIYEGLVGKAAPNFHVEKAQFPITDPAYAVPFYVLSIPANEDDIKHAAEQCRKNHTLQMGISQTVLRDRMFMLEFYAGIPMYAYKDLRDFEAVYNQYKNISPGIHLFEDEEGIDWRKLPSPLPATYVASDYEMPKEVEDVLGLLEKARKYELIQDDKNNNTARIYLSDIEMGKEKFKIEKNATLKELADLTDEMETYKAQCEKNRTLFMELNSNGINYDTSIKDEFARRPDVIEKVRAELDAWKALEAKIQEIKDEMQSKREARDVCSEFIRSLLHGIIRTERSNFKFDFEKRGLTETILVKDEDGRFARYDKIPVYRAFLAFKEMDEEQREQIKEKTQKASNDITDEMYAQTKEFQDFYMGMYKDYMNTAKGEIDCDEITEFLENLADSLKSFIENNK